MTFEEKEREIFFEVVDSISNQSQNWLEKNEIINAVSKKITRQSANRIFNDFSMGDIKYLDDQLNERHKISDAGRVYWEFLKGKSIIDNLQRDLLRSEIDTNASTQALNTKTKDFYTVQRNLTLAIAIATGVYTLFSGISLIKGCNPHEKTSQSQQCKDTLSPMKSPAIAPLKQPLPGLDAETTHVKGEN